MGHMVIGSNPTPSDYVSGSNPGRTLVLMDRTEKPPQEPSRPAEPAPDVAENQDQDQTERDFLRDLDRATRRVERPSEPERGSPRR